MNLKNGTIESSSRYEIIRNGANTGLTLSAIGFPEISMQANSELKMSLSGTFEKNDDLRLLSDRIKPILTLNGVDYPCGLYVVTSSTENRTASSANIALEAYSLLYILQVAKTEDILYFAKGSRYVEAISRLCASAGITEYTIENTNAVFQTDREDWEPGTSYLAIINQLLSEIGYNSAWVDMGGFIRFTQYRNPSAAEIHHQYAEGEASLINDSLTITTDIHGKSNVFVVQCTNPEFATPLVATSVNNSPASPFSTVNLGLRIPQIIKVDNISSQDTLQAYADKLKWDSLLSEESVTFETMINPTHGYKDTIALDVDGLSGVYTETEWSMSMNAQEMMTHKVRRVVYL